MRETRARGGASLRSLLSRLADEGERYRIVYLYGDGRCDLTWREGAGERSLRNFPVKYLRDFTPREIIPQPAVESDSDRVNE